MTAKEITLQQAEIELEKATEHYQTALSATSAARSRECSALNALNEAQRAFDKLVEAKKSSALHGSDWHRKKHEKPIPRDV